MIRLALILFALAAAAAAAQERVIASLSQNRVAITTDFSGSEIFVFGAIERNRFRDERDDELDVIVSIIGPSEPVTVRKKERKFGIWVNSEEFTVDKAPSFYAVATSAPLEDILSPRADSQHSITIESGIRISAVAQGLTNPLAYRNAIIRINRNKGVYFDKIGGVRLHQRTLFQTRVKLPANIFEGDYTARIFLMRGGDVVDKYETAIRVRKVGLERWIYNLAHDYAFIYAVLSILIALLAGYGASEVFRLLRR